MKNLYPTLVIACSFSLLSTATRAIAAAELQYAYLQLNTNSQGCVELAQAVLRNEGFRNLAKSSVSATGTRGNLKAVVDCSITSGRATQATIIVAGVSTNQQAEVINWVRRIYSAIGSYQGSNLPGDTSVGVLMNEREFAQFITALKRSRPNQMEFLAQPARAGYFTVAQVKEIIAAFRFPAEQEDVAVMLYPRVVDKANWYTVYEAFSSSSSRQRVQQRIEGN
ncbi:MAG: DUF4476 domain-containing protein [Spirulinaceae cyanobacterium]